MAKFTDRATGVSRIWKTIQTLGPLAPDTADPETETSETGTEAEPVAQPELAIASEPETPFEGEPIGTDVAPQSPDVAPAQAAVLHETTLAKKAATEPTSAKGPRESSKTNQVIAMLNREGGTTIEEIMTAMGWQKHTTRAMLSVGGSLTKKHGLVIRSEKVGEKRVYSIKA
ncbi:MAG TPA: DUF3489 domain-containing protein [Bryobacteraceae bacterium]